MQSVIQELHCNLQLYPSDRPRRVLSCRDLAAEESLTDVYPFMQAVTSKEGASPTACRGFAVAVTGDHSTPAVYGDHSHEPVPFAVAHVRHAVRKCDTRQSST